MGAQGINIHAAVRLNDEGDAKLTMDLDISNEFPFPAEYLAEEIESVIKEVIHQDRLERWVFTQILNGKGGVDGD